MELNTEEINDAERKTNFSIMCKNIRKYEAEIFYKCKESLVVFLIYL